MQIKTLCKEYPGEFYDEDYYENGRISGKGWLMNYRWMPQRSFREALAVIDFLKLDQDSKVLDFGCAKGFLVRALRELEINAEGCDISKYALNFAPAGCWNAEEDVEWYKRNGEYTHIFCKDVFEHLNHEQLCDTLRRLKSIGNILMCIVPMGDSGKYRIPEYHMEISHQIAEDEAWWRETFIRCGWSIEKEASHVRGLKDNWQSFANGIGNHVFVLR